MIQELDNGTYMDSRDDMWALTHAGYFSSGKAMCPDGVVRNVKIHNVPDTFWTSRAYYCVGHKKVYGFISIDTDEGEIGTLMFKEYMK